MRMLKLFGLIVLVLSVATATADAQGAFPTRTVRIVIPYPAGGGTDTLGRLVADLLSRKWGQTVVVENVGGAAGKGESQDGHLPGRQCSPLAYAATASATRA